jgi:tripartite-type tricarboxylate transporter receptor subunit TctC
MNSTKTRIVMLLIFALAYYLVSLPAGQAQAKYPEKTITFIVPMDAGGGTDGMARALATRLEKELGVSVVVTNEKGSGGRRGSIALFKSAPDGYTIGFPHIATLIYDDTLGGTKSPVDYRKYSVVLRVDTATFFVHVNKNQPFKSVADLKSHREAVKFGSTGIGTPSWLIPAALGAAAGFKTTFVSGHKNLAEVALAVARGDVIGGTGSYTHFRGVINDVRPLVYMSDKKSYHLPEVPPVASIGYPKLASLGVPWAVAAPPGTSEDRLEILRSALRKIIQKEEFMKWAQDNGYEPDTMDPKTFWQKMEDMKEVYLSLKPQMEKK